MIDSNTRIQDAIRNTPQDYLHKCLEQRSFFSATTLGSHYMLSPMEILAKLKTAEWEPYNHSDIKTPAVGFITRSFGGLFGMVQVSDLDTGARIVLNQKHARVDELEGVLVYTGTKTFEKPHVDFTVCILGPNDDSEVLWTFHPGDPIPPSVIKVGVHRDGDRFTKQEAIDAGLRWVKLPAHW